MSFQVVFILTCRLWFGRAKITSRCVRDGVSTNLPVLAGAGCCEKFQRNYLIDKADSEIRVAQHLFYKYSCRYPLAPTKITLKVYIMSQDFQRGKARLATSDITGASGAI
jgi:hypothetical protein